MMAEGNVQHCVPAPLLAVLSIDDSLILAISTQLQIKMFLIVVVLGDCNHPHCQKRLFSSFPAKQNPRFSASIQFMSWLQVQNN